MYEILDVSLTGAVVRNGELTYSDLRLDAAELCSRIQTKLIEIFVRKNGNICIPASNYEGGIFVLRTL